MFGRGAKKASGKESASQPPVESTQFVESTAARGSEPDDRVDAKLAGEMEPHEIVKKCVDAGESSAAHLSMLALGCDASAAIHEALEAASFSGFNPERAAVKLMRAAAIMDKADFEANMKAMQELCVWITVNGTKKTEKVMEVKMYERIVEQLDRFAAAAGFKFVDARSAVGIGGDTLTFARFGQAAAPLMMLVQYQLNKYGPVGLSLVESPNASSFVTTETIGDHLQGLDRFYVCIGGEAGPKYPNIKILRAVLTSKGAHKELRELFGFGGERLMPGDFAGIADFAALREKYRATDSYSIGESIEVFGRIIVKGEAA